MVKQWISVLLLFCSCGVGYAQQGNSAAALLQLTRHSDSLVNQIGAEKLYIQFDKPYYGTGDTIWFKAYLLNVPTYRLSARSGLLHIDIANDSNKVVKQYLLPVENGLSRGSLTLDEKIFKPGDYTLRAYTNWMQNFGSDHFFYKTIRITGANENTWMVTANIIHNTDKQIYRAQLRLSDIDKKPVVDSVFRAEVTDGRKVLLGQNVRTDKSNLLDLTFTLPTTTANPAIVLQNKSRTKRAIIPLNTSQPGNVDLQFLPEGGDLIAGLPARVGFKAIGSDGRSVPVSGVVWDHRDSVITSFKTFYNGMGSFYLNPQAGESYRARIAFKDGSTRQYLLPAVKTSGTLLQVKDLPGSDSLEVVVAATEDIAASMPGYYLICKVRGVVCYAAVVDLGKQQVVRSKIAKNKFPSGIAHFILASNDGKPLNERLFYIDHRDELHIDIEPDRSAYLPKDSIALRVKVTDSSGHPVAGNFSLAVTDDAQVKADSLSENIVTRMLITSDLKGYVENPQFYFRDTDTARMALDNLLLTQGWVNYEPVDNKITYKAETEFTVQGVVNNIFRKPVKKTHIVLFSRSPAILFDTVTNNEGRFIFNRFPRVDTPVFVLKAVNRAGRSFNVNIDVDEYKMPPFAAPRVPPIMPWYVNTDTTMMNQLKNSRVMKQAAIPGGGRLLKEVQIKARKIINGSQNLNGPGNADVVIDEKELEEAGKKTFLDLFQERIKGFKVGYFRTPGWLSRPEYSEVYKFESSIRNASESEWYFIHDKPIILIVDGVDIEDVYPPPFNFAAFMAYMKSHSAEDIKGIEVNFSSRYNSHYLRSGKWMEEPLAEPKVRDFAFVEITTRGGGGALISYTPGLYLYKPLPISWPKQFYKPKYTVKDTLKQADLRSTIDWEPNISTDSAGNARLSFYAASAPSTYTVIAEGVDLNGNIGYKRRKISIVVPKDTTKSK